MKLRNIFKSRNDTVDTLLKNDLCKKLVDQYCNEDLLQTTSLIIIYEVSQGSKKEIYWKCAGIEPAQAILALDQLHHRIQHEGLSDYD